MTDPVRTDTLDEREHRREIANKLNLALRGGVGIVRDLTIANGTTSTVVNDPIAYANSVPVLFPTNAAAAAISPYVTSRSKGTFTLAHADPGASATFVYVLLG